MTTVDEVSDKTKVADEFILHSVLLDCFTARWVTRGAYHLLGWKFKRLATIRSEISGKCGWSLEVIHFSRFFRFSRVARVPSINFPLRQDGCLYA